MNASTSIQEDSIMPHAQYRGTQRLVYLPPELNERIAAYLAQHPETGWTPWVRSLILTALEHEEALCAASATTSTIR